LKEAAAVAPRVGAGPKGSAAVASGLSGNPQMTGMATTAPGSGGG